MSLIKEERVIKENFDELEKQEREHFNSLSNCLRFSHEKERAQNEKTKYWSVVGSVLGAVVGVFGSTINSKIRMAKMEEMLSEKNSKNITILQDQLSLLVEKMDVLSTNTSVSWSSVVEEEKKLHGFMKNIASLSEQIESKLQDLAHATNAHRNVNANGKLFPLFSTCDSNGGSPTKQPNSSEKDWKYFGYFCMVIIPLGILQILKS